MPRGMQLSDRNVASTTAKFYAALFQLLLVAPLA